MRNIKILEDCDIMEQIDERPERIKNIGMFIQDRYGNILDEELSISTPDPRFRRKDFSKKKDELSI